MREITREGRFNVPSDGWACLPIDFVSFEWIKEGDRLLVEEVDYRITLSTITCDYLVKLAMEDLGLDTTTFPFKRIRLLTTLEGEISYLCNTQTVGGYWWSKFDDDSYFQPDFQDKE